MRIKHLRCANLMSKTQAENPGRLVGYARVSTVGQTLDAQIAALKAAGCEIIHREKASGARDDRPVLARMLRSLQPGDMVVVSRIDRLARSVFGLFKIVSDIAAAGARFRSINEPMIDTGSAQGRLVLAVLAGVADIERDLIKTRTAEGRVRAMASGVKMGRKPKLTAAQRTEALRRRAAGESLADIGRSFAVAGTTIGRMK